MTDIDPTFKKIADEHGATLVPYPRLDSQLIFIGGSNRKRVLDSELEEMDAEQFAVLLAGLANPPESEIKSKNIVDWFVERRQRHHPITGHFRS